MPVPISKLEEILLAARTAGASDVHLTAGSPPRMRVGGELIELDAAKLMPSDTLDILLDIMPQVMRDRFEEKGEYVFAFSTPAGGRCRASVYKQNGKVAMALRLVREEIPTLEGLGMPEAVSKLCELEQGLVLVAGPSGSGRSTTLAAMLDQINRQRNVHIITLENPIEYLHPHKKAMVNQREIGVDSNGYPDALRAALREDPDVLLIDGLCGCEAVAAAITAAETGHLVVAVVDTVGVAATVRRIVNDYVPYQQPGMRVRLANVLEAVVSQRLVRESFTSMEEVHSREAKTSMEEVHSREAKTSMEEVHSREAKLSMEEMPPMGEMSFKDKRPGAVYQVLRTDQEVRGLIMEDQITLLEDLVKEERSFG